MSFLFYFQIQVSVLHHYFPQYFFTSATHFDIQLYFCFSNMQILFSKNQLKNSTHFSALMSFMLRNNREYTETDKDYKFN